MTSIPDDLTAAQGEALVAFATFDRFTWSYWFSPAQPGVGTAGAEEYMTADLVSVFQGNYDAQEPGEYLAGPVRVAVLSVDVQDVYVPVTADVVNLYGPGGGQGVQRRWRGRHQGGLPEQD